jgi:hypothetical protein
VPSPTRPVPPAPARTAPGRNVNPLLALATAILAITTIVFGLMALAPAAAPIKTANTQRAAEGSTEKDVQAVAERFTKNLLTYKYQTVTTDVARTLKDATPEFGKRNLEVLGGRDIQAFSRAVAASHATGSVDVKGVVITSRDADTATVLVVSYRTFDSDARKAPSRGLLVTEMALRKLDGSWKVDNLANPARAS